MVGKKRSFNLTELLIVVVAIAILVAIALPRFSIFIERSQVKNAITQLHLLKSSALTYELESGRFPSCSEPPTQGANSCNSIFGLNIDTTQWNYEVNALVPEIKAERATGKWEGCKITLDVNSSQITYDNSASCRTWSSFVSY